MKIFDVDSYNHVGIYSTADIDNGVLVTLNGMNVDATTGKVKGYEYNVALATATSEDCWIAVTPRPNQAIESQLYSDPRYMYNIAGKPISIKHLDPKVDVLKFDYTAFDATPTFAVGDIGKFVKIGSNGKLDADLVSSAPATGTYFRVEGYEDFSIGQELVPGVLLRCMKN